MRSTINLFLDCEIKEKEFNRMDRIKEKSGYMNTNQPMKTSIKVFANSEITEKIIQAAFEVAKELGAGFLESVYQNAMLIALEAKGLKVETEKSILVLFRGKPVGQFFADMLIEERVIVELKAISALAPEHSAQVINYLKATGTETGLLINFGRPKLEIKRLYK